MYQTQTKNEFRVEIKKGKKIINKPPLKAKTKISQNKFKSAEKPVKIAAKCSQMIKQQALAQEKRKKKNQYSITSLKLPLSNISSKSSLPLGSEMSSKISSPNKPAGISQKSPQTLNKFSSHSLKESNSMKTSKKNFKSISASTSKPNITISPA